MLTRQKELFSDAFYMRHREHTLRLFKIVIVLLSVSGGLTAIFLFLAFQGSNTVVLASITGAIFLFLAWSSFFDIRNHFQVCLLPYFERPLKDADTFLAGRSLLWNSRKLDELADQFNITRLSSFASGDDMIRGESLRWFRPDDALITTERLLKNDVATLLSPEVLSDLTRLRNALQSACTKKIQFCFLIREGTLASGLEMDRRKGSFF